VAGAKIHNLDQLHDADSRHRYNAALEGDVEYVIRHEIFGLFRSTGATLASKDPERVDAPADECLENLIELEAIDSKDPVTAGRQVEWFARLAVEDPWQLSRERAVLALTNAGLRLQAGLPSALGSDQKAADPETVVNAVTPLVRVVRGVLEKTATRAELEAACDAVRALDYDMAGGRRALALVVALQRTAGTRNADVAPLAELALDLQRICVRRALAMAIDDASPPVRAAALRSTARIGGRRAIDGVLFDRLKRETEPEVVVVILDTLAELGPLPESAGPGEVTRDKWLELFYKLLVSRPESEVHVHAMMALSKLSGAGFSSLREEDWQTWWNARAAASRNGAAATSGAAAKNADGNGSGASR
jgi:hypothetical protein